MASGEDRNYLGITALVTAVFQFAFFIVAATFKFDKVTDFAGVSNFVLLAVLTFFLNNTWLLRQIVLTSFVIVWGIRLAVFLLLRILEWGEDRRMDGRRDNLLRFAIFWTIQGIWVWTVSLPLTIVNGVATRSPELQAADFVGWAMWAIGAVIEMVADQQKLSFKKDPASRGKWCDIGVWKFSRHPNYFGEILLWWGIFVAATPLLRGSEWAVIAGPIFITLLLLFVSGIPLLEINANKKHGGNSEYHIYRNKTSPLIPLPTSLYGSLPKWVKSAFLFELPLYSRKLATGEELLQSET
jgi:steroid 5-alpha reductase family enzyme